MVQEKDSSEQRAADASRIEGYLRGDGAAYGELDRWIRTELQRSYPRLSGELDDLCQEVHAKVLVELRADRFEGRSRLRAYVGTIAQRTALRKLRTVYRDRAIADTLESQEEPAGENPYDTVEIRDEIRLAHQAVMALPETCRELWKLLFVEKLNYEEAGERLSIPTGTVKSRMWHCRHKAMKALRRLRLLGKLRFSSP